MLNATFSILCLWLAIMMMKTQVYLYYGKAIASPEFLSVEPNGHQNALTNSSNNKWFFLAVASVIGMVVYYFTVSWLFGVIAIVNFFLMMVLINIFYPKPSSKKHLKKLIYEMANRKADYLKNNDQERADAVDHLLAKLMILLEESE